MEIIHEPVQEISYVIGQRGRQLVMTDGYTFHKDKKNYYRCGFCTIETDRFGNEIRNRCPVRIKEIVTDGERKFVYTQGNAIKHNHIKKYLMNEEIKETLEKTIPEGGQLEYNEMELMTNTYKKDWGIEWETYFKKIDERIKEEENKRLESIRVQTKDYVKFRSDDVIIVGDEEVYKKIWECNRIYCDGTFDAVSKGMYQLYTIHGIVDEIAYPFFYCILKNKKPETYATMFKKIDDLTNNRLIRGIEIMGDYEIMNFKEQYFTKKKYCYFHYCKCITKRKTKKTSEELVKGLKKLPFIHINMVIPVFQFLRLEYGTVGLRQYSRMNKKLLDYFYKQFIINKKLPIEAWNLKGEEIITNNICETYHRSLNSFLRIQKPKIEEFVFKLVNYNNMRKEMVKKEIGYPFKQRKLKETIEELKKQGLENTIKNPLMRRTVREHKIYIRENTRKLRFKIFQHGKQVIRKDNINETRKTSRSLKERKRVLSVQRRNQKS